MLDGPSTFQEAPLITSTEAANVAEFDDTFFMNPLPVIWDNNAINFNEANMIGSSYIQQSEQADYATLNTIDQTSDLSQMFDMADLFLGNFKNF